MGNEIHTSHFSLEDSKIFTNRLYEETQLVSKWFENNRFSSEQKMFGYELEAWLVNKHFQPAPNNEKFLQ